MNVAIAPAVRERAVSAEAPPLRGILTQALWFALVTGLLEYGAREFNLRVLHHVILAAENPHDAWMTFADQIAIFGAAGVLLWAVQRLAPRLVTLHLSSFVFSCLLFFSLGDVVAVRQWYAWLALGLGVGSALARLIAGHASSYAMLVRRTVEPLMAAAVVVALVAYGASIYRERAAAAATGVAAATAPNLLFITLDTVRAQDMSLYGYNRPTTPELEKIAADGVCFDRAISTVSWTLPSHATMFTGHYGFEIFHDFSRMDNQDWELPMGKEYPTLAEFLGARGYRTGGFVANWMYCDRVYGLDRGFATYRDYDMSLPQVIKSSFLTRAGANTFIDLTDRSVVLARKSAAVINGELLDWLDRERTQPFFAFLNYMDVHEPYAPLPPYAGTFTTEQAPPVPKKPPTWKVPADVAMRRLQYDETLAYLDHELGELFNELEHRGRLKNTVVIITADHGEHFGEHGIISHGDTLYMPVLHVPLMILDPENVATGQRVSETVSLRDLPATVAELLHLENAPFPGRSLARFWNGHPGPPEPAFANLDCTIHRPPIMSITHLKSLVDDRYQYISDVGNVREELYDLGTDPNETADLAGLTEHTRTPKTKKTLDEFRRYLHQHFSEMPPGLPATQFSLRALRKP